MKGRDVDEDREHSGWGWVDGVWTVRGPIRTLTFILRKMGSQRKVLAECHDLT